jgi:hypothetical protein
MKAPPCFIIRILPVVIFLNFKAVCTNTLTIQTTVLLLMQEMILGSDDTGTRAVGCTCAIARNVKTLSLTNLRQFKGPAKNLTIKRVYDVAKCKERTDEA